MVVIITTCGVLVVDREDWWMAAIVWGLHIVHHGDSDDISTPFCKA